MLFPGPGDKADPHILPLLIVLCQVRPAGPAGPNLSHHHHQTRQHEQQLEPRAGDFCCQVTAVLIKMVPRW